ncbi:uncharacterized protein TNCV_1872441 [Trichonephila clavipes]|nr:uncharacterized protein TNCV_1872441 [Trichonephila clavipes]
MTFESGCKVFQTCSKCHLLPASPEHILDCLGLALEDVHASPLLMLDFARVNGLMDLIQLPLDPEGLDTTTTDIFHSHNSFSQPVVFCDVLVKVEYRFFLRLLSPFRESPLKGKSHIKTNPGNVAIVFASLTYPVSFPALARFQFKNRKDISYPTIISSAIRPVPHDADLPIPSPPDTLDNILDDLDQISHISSDSDDGYNPGTNDLELFSQSDLNNLVRDLGLPKDTEEVLGSRLKERHLLNSDVSFSWYRFREKEFVPFLRKRGT